MHAGILPVKHLDRAKGRLAPHFSAAERQAIARALWADALEMCADAQFLHWWVVSDDDAVLEAASARGLEVARDPGRGLNEALAMAIDGAMRVGARSATVIPSDVPLTQTSDLRDLLDVAATSAIVVVPARRDGGTNGLSLSPPDVIPPQFGPGSLRAHVGAADRGAHRCSVLPLERMAIDIDTPGDIDAFLVEPGAARSHTGALLARLRPPGHGSGI